MPNVSNRSLLSCITAAALAALSAPASAALDTTLGVVAPAQRTDQFIVKAKVPGAEAAGRVQQLASAALARAGVATLSHRLGAAQSSVLKLQRHVDVAVLERIGRALKAEQAEIEFAEPDVLLQADAPNDPEYANQWHYQEPVGGIKAPAAWKKSKGEGIVVAVIDTGFRPHADLAANLLPGYDMIGDTTVANDGDGRDADASDPGDWVVADQCGSGLPARNSSWHGTHVAGTIAAVTNNALGVAGVARAAKVLPVRVLGRCGGYTSDIADAIYWASGASVSGVPNNPTPARVLSLSLGGASSCAMAMQGAINAARSRGSVVVVAAGNSNGDVSAHSPANCAGVVAVGATDRVGGRSYYSNFGALIDVSAPGGDMRSSASNGVLSTLNTGTTVPGADSYAYYQGTSMATPHVSATVALMLAQQPGMSADEVEVALKSTARAFPVACGNCGRGIVDAAKAVNKAITGSVTTTLVNEAANNNTIATAQVLSGNPVRVSGSIDVEGDLDHYAVTLAAGRSLTLTLTPPTDRDYDLRVLDAAGNELAKSALGTGSVDALSFGNASTTTQTYYVQVTHFVYGSGSYRLDVQK